MNKVKMMMLLLTMLLVGILLIGCTESYEREMKDMKSSISGLNRVVYVYDDDGNVMKTYEGQIDIEDNEYGNKVKFDLNGKRIIIYNATVIVEEK
ncbi:DUF5052 family protein [Vallitalea okinawensis]|uniref:DUF5052 family protein n=1 Tax=Vallitalea okinawensis TaxID=2078660 RepID=UPI001A9A61EE|nr:DUF5052 family protein [Vallitalea okinawensis]